MSDGPRYKHQDIKPFSGQPSIPEDVYAWAKEVGNDEGNFIMSGQWMARLAYVQFWLHICDTKVPDER
jgi:hypothetical protein